MKDLVSDYILLNHRIGNDLAYVQGAGGNISIKTHDEKMLIKASGFHLRELKEDYGSVLVKHKQIKEHLESDVCLNDEQYTSLVLKNTLSKDEKLRASMETGFHSLLRKVTVHTHNVFINLLTCAQEGPQILSELFPVSCFVKFANPGMALTLQIQKAIYEKPESKIIFLQNHGVIVSGESCQEVEDLHAHITEKILDFLHISRDSYENYSNNMRIPEDIIFPDQAVFMSKPDTEAAKENFKAAHYIMHTIKNIGLTPRYLEKQEGEDLRAMESEKFRLKVSQ